MEYKLSLGEWSSVFAVPCGVVDKYIRSSNEIQLKVLLWVLRNSGKNIDVFEACSNLEITIEQFNGAFLYWNNLKVFSVGESIDLSGEPLNEESKKLRKPSLKYQRLESSHVASRIKESKDINYLMHEAQLILGRPISNIDSTVLLMLHDNEGLPIDVILMLLQYSASIGKFHIRYIEKIGMEWAALGIDNIEKAERKIHSTNHLFSLWKRFQRLIGIESRAATSFEEETISKWYDEWKFKDELIKYAYEICVTKHGKYVLKYMDGILKQWYSQGLYSIEQVKDNKFSHKRKESKNVKSDTSYNINEYEDYLKHWYNQGMFNGDENSQDTYICRNSENNNFNVPHNAGEH